MWNLRGTTFKKVKTRDRLQLMKWKAQILALRLNQSNRKKIRLMILKSGHSRKRFSLQSIKALLLNLRRTTNSKILKSAHSQVSFFVLAVTFSRMTLTLAKSGLLQKPEKNRNRTNLVGKNQRVVVLETVKRLRKLMSKLKSSPSSRS